MSSVVGIDLGTTNTVVAAVQGVRAATLANEHGERLIPSVVSFHPNGSVLVGKEAKTRRLQDAPNTIYSTKRLIGRTFGSAEVRRARARAPYEINEGPGHSVLVVARGESYTLSEIGAFVLRECKRIAEVALGDTVDRAVVTVPANFNDLQRAATKVAGHIAGIEVLRILNEPTAAALAYGYGKGNKERIAVYDFGGGTFDVTLLDLAGNVFEVLATAGDTFLGGDDLDQAIADRIADRYLQKHRYDPRTDRQVYERLLFSAEELKIALSTKESATVHLQEVAYGPGGKALDMPFSMSRKELDALLAPLLGRTLKVCEDALSVARLEPDAFDQIVVVGGTTRIPAVRSAVAEFFGKRPLDRLSPDEVVALGAAIQATALTASERRRGGGTVILSKGAPKKVTDPGIGSLPGEGVGMIPAPVEPLPLAGASPITLPQDPSREVEDTITEVMTRNLLLASEAVMHAPEAASGPTMVSDTDKASHRGVRTAPGLAPVPVDAIPIPLPLVTPSSPQGKAASPSGLRVLDDDPTELRSATKELREMLRGEGEGAAGRMPVTPPPEAGHATARMGLPRPGAGAPPANKPPQAPPVGQTTAKMPSHPPRAPAGQTTAKMPSHPPAPPAGAKVGPRGTRVDPTALATANAFAAAAAASAKAPSVPPARPAAVQTTLTGPAAPLAPPTHTAPGLAPAPQHARDPLRQGGPPLLLDVTPLTLTVETVNNYCDVIISRNTPIPCQRTRRFATASDNQTTVRINAAQGESARFSENTLLGQVELSGLRAAPRGEVQIDVTFEIDANGILDVRAADIATGKSAQARIKLTRAIPGTDDLERMRERVRRAL